MANDLVRSRLREGQRGIGLTAQEQPHLTQTK
jgi:hypothetical protein